MAPTPSSTTSSSTPHSPDGQFRVVRKRNRIPLSCAPCRHRKLKCNRGQPCDNCSKRGDLDSCTYASPGARKKHSSSSSSSNSPDDMQNRIDRLENLVLSLMTNGAQSAGPSAAAAAIARVGSVPTDSISGSSAGFPVDIDRDDMIKEEIEGQEDNESEVDRVAKSIGVMKVDSNRNLFISEAHWYSILAEISEVKNYFQDHKTQYEDHLKKINASKEEAHGRAGAGFLFITEPPANKAEILRSLPPKGTTDLLISRFFNTYTYDPAFQLIHGPTYQKQYDQHWATPNETDVIWLGMTYGMMVIALQSYHRAGDEPPEYRGRTWQMLQDYKRLTAQCLILADITQPITYMMETLILYVMAEFGRSRDAEAGVMVGFTVIVRLAMRMGYHRDSKFFPAITPFQGEMRRRLWTIIRQADLLFSSQAGLPPMIRPEMANTEYPLNVYDDELFEDMKSLPPSRPMTELTPMCYVIYKSQLIDILGEVVEEVQTLGNSSYETVMKLDHRLRELHSNIPPIYKMRSIEESLRDPSALVVKRYTLDLLFLKSMCVLHRKFSGLGGETSRYAYSRRTAIECGMEMLRHQATLHVESRPGGRLSDFKWFISSLTSHDFLLAAMIVCMDLYQAASAEKAGRRASTDLIEDSKERRANMTAAIEQSFNVWDSQKEESIDAYKAIGILTALQAKLQSQEAQLKRQQQVGQPGGFGTSRYSANGAGAEDVKLAPEHSAAMTLGMLSTGALSPNTTNMFANPPYDNSQATQAQQQQQVGGLASQFLGSASDQNNVPASAASPFSQLFGSGIGFQSMDLPTANIDWDIWDSYLQGNALDPSTTNIWPMNVDPAILDPGGNGNGISSSSQAMNGAGGSAGPELDPNLQQQAQNGFLGTGNAF